MAKALEGAQGSGERLAAEPDEERTSAMTIETLTELDAALEAVYRKRGPFPGDVEALPVHLAHRLLQRCAFSPAIRATLEMEGLIEVAARSLREFRAYGAAPPSV
jgi:hypothetical protein